MVFIRLRSPSTHSAASIITARPSGHWNRSPGSLTTRFSVVRGSLAVFRDITEELQKFGRAGVPLVLVYPADRTKEPRVLPEALTPSIVMEALAAAAK